MSIARAEQLLQAGIAAAKVRDFVRAREWLCKSIEIESGNADAWVWLSAVAETPEYGVRALERAIQINPTHGPAIAAIKVARLDAGVSAAQANRKDDARRWLKAACSDEPANESAWLWLASVTDIAAEAIEYLQKALQLNPANERARVGIERLRAEIQVGQRWGCPICLAEASARFTTCPQCRAVLDLARGDEAIGNPNPDVAKIRAGAERLSAALRSDPNFVHRYYLGMALLNLGKPDEAIGHFRAARSMRANDSGLANQIELLQRALADSAPPTQRMDRPFHESETEQPAKSILVVDQSTTIRKLVGMTLRKNGYAVLEAQDGLEAWQLIESGTRPDLVVLDLNLPLMDGHSLCRAIRRQPAIAKMPLVALTIEEPRGNPDPTKSLDAHLSKPFHPATLAKAVRDLCPLAR